MKNVIYNGIILLLLSIKIQAQVVNLQSPNKNITISIQNGNTLQYNVLFHNKIIVETSQLGFELKKEAILNGDFQIIDQHISKIEDTWQPVVKSKHALVLNHYNELKLRLKEKSGNMRCMDLFVRAYNDGIAFRYKLYRSESIGNREIIKELTTFHIPNNVKGWIADYGRYSSHQQDEFFEHPVSDIEETSIHGLPLLMEFDNNTWVAIAEANIENYPGFYIGTNGKTNELTTKLAPLPRETEQGVKVRFDSELLTPWRVLMIGDSVGDLIESEIIPNLNEPCAIADTSWIVPGMSAWDHWWSGDVKMEMPVIKEYIDLASNMDWEYMLIDWKWYGSFNKPEADITKWAPQLDMPEILQYAKTKNVRILLWLHSTDVNRNSNYKKAFKLYNEWGIAGVKIDFMNRDDQEMVNWYHDIIKEAAKNKLLVNFHGAYKPDGISRTYPNMITREGVMGNELNKFSKKYHLSAEHNVKLAFTRMLLGQMDFTPGGFLNVTKKAYKKQVPAMVMSTRAGELAKFVVYESPLTVACDHPDNYLNQPGSDFLKIVPTVWHDTKFVDGHPSTHIAMARKNEDTWFLGVLNNSNERKISIPLNFLEEGFYEMEVWADSKESNEQPSSLTKALKVVKNNEIVKINLAINGGFVARINKKK